MGKVIIFSAPSGSGKSTIVNALLERNENLRFSVSATSRAPRGAEQNGVEYYFFSNDEFMLKVGRGDFLEWEEVYAGTCYGTLKSEIERIWSMGAVVVFDVDVIGGLNIKTVFGSDALSIFIMPPSIEELHRRLVARATETPEAISRRMAKAEQEIAYSDKFDAMVVNDNLQDAINQTEIIINNYIKTDGKD
ncbi:Guanylate kinase [Mucinivorans hirudinis]|uniref:Guanylate kinase n=1 Tax=Mucinivorans hirudinis TaxID=1433126 RepID=A0A060R927_9BACT|nr:Guanylate kinase [Mucinivorans hirudinis]